jgi:mannose-6-phosphate isomerase-like protein (cupin superfamily)
VAAPLLQSTFVENETMHEAIRRTVPAGEFYIHEGCFVNELSNSDADSEVSIARVRVPSRATTKWHRLVRTAERYVLLSGTGRVEVGDLAPQIVTPGDVVLIPPDCRQRIANIGDGDLIFLAICTPRFRPEAYEDIDAI